MNKIIIAFALLILAGCDARSELAAIGSMSDEDKSWIFAEFNLEEEDNKIDAYYYYGKVSDSLLALIKQNEISAGFILLEEVRYWGDNDIVYEYFNEEYTGDLIFRIEDIAKIKFVHTPPEVGSSYEQYEDQASESEETISDAKTPDDS